MPSEDDYQAVINAGLRKGEGGKVIGLDADRLAAALSASHRVGTAGVVELARRLVNSGAGDRETIQRDLARAMIRRQNEAGFGGVRFGDTSFMRPRRVGESELFVEPLREGNWLSGRTGYNLTLPGQAPLFIKDAGTFGLQDVWPTWSEDTRQRYQSEAKSLGPLLESLMRMSKGPR
jgi:hypothetical protein